MTEVQAQTTTNYYDNFIETMEEFNNISGKNESSQNLYSLDSTNLSKNPSRQDFLNYFMKACNQINAMESSDSLVSMSTVSSRNSLSGMDNNSEQFSIFSFFKAMESLSLNSTNSVGDLMNPATQSTVNQDCKNSIFYDFFLKLELFLIEEQSSTN